MATEVAGTVEADVELTAQPNSLAGEENADVTAAPTIEVAEKPSTCSKVIGWVGTCFLWGTPLLLGAFWIAAAASQQPVEKVVVSPDGTTVAKDATQCYFQAYIDAGNAEDWARRAQNEAYLQGSLQTITQEVTISEAANPVLAKDKVTTYVMPGGNPTDTVYCTDLAASGYPRYTMPDQWLQAVLSFFPIIIVFLGILGFDLSSRYVAPVTCLITIIMGVWFFMNQEHTLGRTYLEVAGMTLLTLWDRLLWTIFDYALSVFAAFLFMNVLQKWGIVDQMRRDFEMLAPTPNRKILLVLFCFAIMMAVVAPGGSNFLIAGMILIDMNISGKDKDDPERGEHDKHIATVCLFGNGLTSAFNLVGVCIIALSDIVSGQAPSVDSCVQEGGDSGALAKCGEKKIGFWFGLQFYFLSMVSPFIMCAIIDYKSSMTQRLKNLWPDFWPLLMCGILYATMQWIIAGFVGPELPCLVAAFVPLLFYASWEMYQMRKNRPADAEPTKWGEEFKKRSYMIPFILFFVLILMFTMMADQNPINQALSGKLKDADGELINPTAYSALTLKFLDIKAGGYVWSEQGNKWKPRLKYSNKFSWLVDPAMVIILVSILTPFIVRYTDSNAAEDLDKKSQDVGPPKTTSGGRQLRGKDDLLKGWRKMTKKLIRQARDNREAEKPVSQRRCEVLKTSLKEAILEALPVLLAIWAYASLAKVMIIFSMSKQLAMVMQSAFKDATWLFAIFSPIFGFLGSALTGSTTTSNFLFGDMQVRTATDLGLLQTDANPNRTNTLWEVAAIQVLGATGGEIISPMNAVFSTLLLKGRYPESDLIKSLIPLASVWMLIIILISIMFLIP